MLTPKYLKGLPDNIIRIFEELEEDVIADVARRIAEGMELTETADYQIDVLAKMGYKLTDIKKEIAKSIDKSEKEVEKLLQDSSYLSYQNDKELYQLGGKVLPDIKNNPMMNSFIIGVIKQTKGKLRNITNTLGFVDGGKFKDLDKFYKDTLDYAVFQLGSDAFDYNTVLKNAVKKLSDSGIRTIDYSSGRKYNIDSAVRMTVMTGVTQITGRMSEMNAGLMDQDLMEITAHSGARPSHKEWQGQIVSRSGKPGYLTLDDIAYNSGDGFQGYNCRHGWFPYFEGISKPAYLQNDLDNIDPQPFEYDNKVYTHYEATQKQRYIERQIKKTKRNLIAYDAAGLKEDFTTASVKLRRQRELYKDFSRKAKLRQKLDRTGVYGYNRSISSKSVWAEKKGVVDKYSGYLGTKKYSEVVSKLKEIEKNKDKWLLDGFVKAVDKGDISPLVGIDKYIETSRQIEKELIGITTKNNIKIEGYVTHFIDRVIGQHSVDDVSRKGMRRGVHIEDVKDAILNGNVGEKKIKRDGKPSIVFSNNKCKTTLNPDSKELIQVNPYSRFKLR